MESLPPGSGEPKPNVRMQPLEAFVAQHDIALVNLGYDISIMDFDNLRVEKPIAWLLVSILSPKSDARGQVPPFKSSPLFTKLTEQFVRVRNDPSRIERFFQRLLSHDNQLSRICARVCDALDYALEPDCSIASGSASTTSTTSTTSIASTPRPLWSASTTNAHAAPSTIFGRELCPFRSFFQRSFGSEALLERLIVSQMFSPLIALFQPQCDQPIVPAGRLRPDWAFFSKYADSTNGWLVVETKSNAEDVQDATAILIHLQSALHQRRVSSERQLMRSEFNIGLRIFVRPGSSVRMEPTLLTFSKPTQQWHYYRLPLVHLEGNEFEPARRLIATLVLIGTLLNATLHPQMGMFVPHAQNSDGTTDGETSERPPKASYTLPADGGASANEQQPPGRGGDSLFDRLEVSEQAALSSFALLPERSIPFNEIDVVSRSRKTIVLHAAASLPTSQPDWRPWSAPPSVDPASAAAPSLLAQHGSGGREQVVIKVTQNLAEAAVEVAALRRLRGVKGVVPLIECFRLAKSDDPFLLPPPAALEMPGDRQAQARLAMVMPFVPSRRSLRNFRHHEAAFKKIVRRLVRVLHECHMRHVAHGDIREANILIEAPSLEVTLIDFGFATIDSRKSLIGSHNSRKEDLRQVALVMLEAMCELEYGKSEHGELLHLGWSTRSAARLLRLDERAQSFSRWQLEVVQQAIKWGSDGSEPSHFEMHEWLLDAAPAPAAAAAAPAPAPAPTRS